MPAPTPTLVLPIEHIWQRSLDLAQVKLEEKGLPLLELSDSMLKPVADIWSITGGLKESIEQRGKGPGVGRWRKILETVDSYSRVFDMAIQHNAAITALVWASVRAILVVRLEFLSSFYSMVENSYLTDYIARLHWTLS